ncbi:MAG: hypothetical protein ABIQ16_09455 [Polyangiaceae bacterium]
MKIWMANSRGSLAQDHSLFTVICENLLARRGGGGIAHFLTLQRLARLPWLDQPQLIEPTILTLELYSAWEELWTVELSQLSTRPRETQAAPGGFRGGLRGSATFGSYFAAPMHQLAAFAASTTRHRRLRVATHRGLAVGSTAIAEIRVVQGGRSTGPSGRSKD